MGIGRWRWRKEARESLRGEGARLAAGGWAAGLGRSPNTECAVEPSHRLPSARLTVQKQLGLFHKRRCDPKADDETSAAWGPPLGRLGSEEGDAPDGDFLTPKRAQNQHIWPGCPQMFPAGQGSDLGGLLGPFPPGTRGSLPQASPDHPSFVSKEERNYLGLFVYALSWYREPERPSGGRGWQPRMGVGVQGLVLTHSVWLLRGPRPPPEPEPSFYQ